MFRLPWQRVWETLRSDPFYGDSTVVGQCLFESAEILGECVRFLIVREVVAEIRPTRWDGKSAVGVALHGDSCGMKQLPFSIEHHLANLQDYAAENKRLPYEQLIEFDGEVISIRAAIIKHRTPNSHVQLLFLWNLNGLPLYFEGIMQPATIIDSASPFPEFKRFVSPLTPLLYVDKDDLSQYLSSRNMPLPSALFPEEIGTRHFFDSVNDPNNIWKPTLMLNGARQFLASQSANSATFPVAVEQDVPEAAPALAVADKTENDVQKKRKYKKGDLTQKQAAALCGVSERLFQMWENGERTPDNFPGRFDAIAFRAWAESYLSQERLKQAAISMNRASDMDPADIERREDKGDSWV